MANIKNQGELRNENVAEQISKSEQFYNKNKKKIWGTIAAIAVVFLGALGYAKLIYAPACEEAQAATFAAEAAFQAGNFDLALNGDGQNLGFADICSQYGAKAGQAVYLYAAVCCAQAGNWEDALLYAGKYNGKDPILAARAIALKGDAYVALEVVEQAVKCYEKAAAKADNVFAAAYLVKAGVAYESLGLKGKALDCYKQVQYKYAQSVEAYDIDKYIARVSE